MIIVSGSDTFNARKTRGFIPDDFVVLFKMKVYLTANILSSKSCLSLTLLYLNLKSELVKAIKFRIRTNNTSVICNFIDFPLNLM
jgi:hypothetical protein